MRSRVRARMRVRIKIFWVPMIAYLTVKVFLDARWGFGKYGPCQIGYRRKKIDFFHPVF